MKWLRGYSFILLVISVFLLLSSFFVVDILPVLYKMYMGYEISSSKLDKLVSFGLKITNELKLYALLLIVTALSLYFIKTLSQYFILLLFLVLIHFIFIAEIGMLGIARRLYFMSIMLPLLWIFFDFFKFKKENYKNKITHAFLYVTLLSIVLPGLYLPPFFSGISGWTVELDRNKAFPIHGVFLVRNDDKEIRFSRAIVSPINFLTRLNTYMLRAHPEKVNDLLKFYKLTYIKRYDLLAKGLVPSQKNLGKFAYPSHNPHGNFDYSMFPPHSIIEIKLSIKYYNWDKEFIREEVLERLKWQ